MVRFWCCSLSFFLRECDLRSSPVELDFRTEEKLLVMRRKYLYIVEAA